MENGVLHLSIPPGKKGRYRLAQLDDYAGRSRFDFPWHPPLTFTLEARVSSLNIPGTWGFGLWNDPFNILLGFGGGTRRFPALPNAAWFFFAAPPNYLSFQDNAPAQGFLAQTFQAPSIPPALLAIGTLGAPLLFWHWLARKLRSLFNRIIKGASSAITVDVEAWHTYTLEWRSNRVSFHVDNERVSETGISPNSPLGMVLWIDNQYAAYPPDGRLSYGTLPANETAWMELRSLSLST
jgi:hypothetical protein